LEAKLADNTNRLAGIAFISVDGQSYMLQADLTYRVSTVERETLRDAKNLSVASFNSMTNSTVVLQLANGKTIIGRNMWTVDVQEVKTAEATFDVKWEGPVVSEN
jgi:hypothetical protein